MDRRLRCRNGIGSGGMEQWSGDLPAGALPCCAGGVRESLSSFRTAVCTEGRTPSLCGETGAGERDSHRYVSLPGEDNGGTLGVSGETETHGCGVDSHVTLHPGHQHSCESDTRIPVGGDAPSHEWQNHRAIGRSDHTTDGNPVAHAS